MSISSGTKFGPYEIQVPLGAGGMGDWLKQLPSSFTGEKHVVMVKCEPTGSPNVEQCEFEERPGQGPPYCFTGNFTVYCLQENIATRSARASTDP